MSCYIRRAQSSGEPLHVHYWPWFDVQLKFVCSAVQYAVDGALLGKTLVVLLFLFKEEY